MNDGADLLAKQGAQKPPAPIWCPLNTPIYIPTGSDTMQLCPKVTTDLQETPGLTSNPDKISLQNSQRFYTSKQTFSQNPKDHLYESSHRGRSLTHTLQQQNRDKLSSCRSEIEYWKIIRSWTNGRPPPPTIPLQQMTTSIQRRFDKGSLPDPSHFNSAKRVVDSINAANIPEHTHDNTSEQYFTKPITNEEVEWGKSRIKDKTRSARGEDGISYADILYIPNEDIVLLYNACLDTLQIPSPWLRCKLIPLLKQNKPSDNPDSYRIIALESCLLKMLTMIIDNRMRSWADSIDILPATQNGFRPGFRTNNNVYILQCAIELAEHSGKPLYAAFIDLSNAFPSIDHSALWLKLLQWGTGGKIFDWLRKLYSQMAYFLSLSGENSHSFLSTLGILQGDPASPFVFLLYIADFFTPDHPDDISLRTHKIPHLEHADDIVLLSTSPEGLQNKLDALAQWDGDNFMTANALKSWIMIFGKSPPFAPPFTLHDNAIQIVDECKYVGVNISSSSSNIFEPHYNTKASKARHIANTSFCVESYTGVLDPWNARKLYMARIDPHLTSACDICVDYNQDLLHLLEDVQHTFFRRVLGLSSRSMTAPIATELDIWPLKYRRLHLCLNYVNYAFLLPNSHLARAAMSSSSDLASLSKPKGWYAQLRFALYCISPHLSLPLFESLSPNIIDTVKKGLETAMMHSLQLSIDTSPKLYLLRDRTVIDKNGRTSKPTTAFRPYLTIPNAYTRRHLTKLILSDHGLAIERLRRQDKRNYHIERHNRKCRLCLTEVESPEHALFGCPNTTLCSMRTSFRSKVSSLAADAFETDDPIETLKRLLSSSKPLPLLAQYASDVLQFFDNFPLYIHPGPVVS